jgi:hypothetical protein
MGTPFGGTVERINPDDAEDRLSLFLSGRLALRAGSAKTVAGILLYRAALTAQEGLLTRLDPPYPRFGATAPTSKSKACG